MNKLNCNIIVVMLNQIFQNITNYPCIFIWMIIWKKRLWKRLENYSCHSKICNILSDICYFSTQKKNKSQMQLNSVLNEFNKENFPNLIDNGIFVERKVTHNLEESKEQVHILKVLILANCLLNDFNTESDMNNFLIFFTIFFFRLSFK